METLTREHEAASAAPDEVPAATLCSASGARVNCFVPGSKIIVSGFSKPNWQKIRPSGSAEVKRR